jgi:tetratricopeptide (TPR) repeat protein
MLVRFRLRALAASGRLPVAILAALAPWSASAVVPDAGGAEPPEEVRALALPEATERRVESMSQVATGALVEDRDPEEAMRHYLRAIELDTSYSALAEQLAAMHLQLGEVPEALAVLKDSLKRNPGDASLRLRIAEIYLGELAKYELAERYAREALELEPDLIGPYQILYTIYRGTDRARRARDILDQAGRRKSEDPLFWAGLGDLWSRQLFMDGKLREPEAAAPALAHYRKAFELGRQDPAVLLRALDFFIATRSFDDAIACGQRLLVLQPSDIVTRQKLALSLAGAGREDEAMAQLDLVVAENATSLPAYRAHAEILMARALRLAGEGRNEEALADQRRALDKFEKALALSGDDPASFVQLADLSLKCGQPDRAVRWLGAGREKFDRLPEFPFLEGQVLAQLKRWREALDAMNVAAQLARAHNPSFLNAEFHFQHGILAERSGDHDAAAAHFQACLDLEPQHGGALNYLGYMWAERGENLAEAERLIRSALDVEPDNPAYLDSLGWVLYRQGRYHEALPPIERAIKLLPAQDPTVEEHHGDVLSKLGRAPDALKAWERAASLEGASPALADKLRSARSALGLSTAEARPIKP